MNGKTTIFLPNKYNDTTTAAKQDGTKDDSKPSCMKDLKPSSIPGTISDTMEAMLECYNELDDNSKKALMHHAITTGNEALQRWLMLLCNDQSKHGSIAKLTKEIFKLADT